MKKLSLFLIICLFLFVGSNGSAATIVGTTKIIGGTSYDIINRDDALNPNAGATSWTNVDGHGDGMLASPSSGSLDVAALDNWSGYYLGTVKTTSGTGTAKDTTSMIEALMSEFLDETFTVTGSDKVEAPDQTNETSTTDDDLLNIYYDVEKSGEPGEYVAGRWETVNINDLINVYTVKSSNEFALYYVDPALQSGFWSSVHNLASNNNVASISHFTGSLTTTTPSTDPPGATVPEPGTMMLLGFGLISLAGIGRRKIKQ